MPSALQYADWLVEYCAKEVGAPIDPMTLEKHLYYAQSFSLALCARPLFTDDFEAWRLGPVVRNVWNRYGGSAPINERKSSIFQFSASAPLEPDEQARGFLSDVIGLFSRLNTFELSRATHVETPWIEARGGRGPREAGNEKISTDLMQTYYSDLMEEGAEALSRRALLSELPSPRWGWMYVAGICARNMVTHPFYFHGLSLWGAKAKLSEPLGEQPKYDRELFSPFSAEEVADTEVYETADEFLASLKRA